MNSKAGQLTLPFTVGRGFTGEEVSSGLLLLVFKWTEDRLTPPILASSEGTVSRFLRELKSVYGCHG
jgi:hypothetical protein